MESEMFEIMYEIESISTGKVLTEASIQGIPIHVLDDPETLEADLAAISAHSVVKNHIRDYVNTGYVAMIPQQGVTVGNWSGQGWIVMDEETGAAGYMICGGLHGENTLISGGSLSKIINNFYKSLAKMGKKAWAWGDKKAIANTAIIAAAIHLITVIYMLASGHYFFAGICLALFVVAILMTLVLIRLLEQYSWVIDHRRRRYAFA